MVFKRWSLILIIKVSLALHKTNFHCVFDMAAGSPPPQSDKRRYIETMIMLIDQISFLRKLCSSLVHKSVPARTCGYYGCAFY